MLVISAACGHAQANGPLSDSPAVAPPIQGTFNLPDGQPARYVYYFNHNGLADAVFSGQTLIALSESGNLLRFDSATLRLTGQAVVPERGTTLALDGQGKALVGTQTGHIYKVDSSSLALREVAPLAGKIVWLGSSRLLKGGGEEIVGVVDASEDAFPWPGESDKAYNRRGIVAARRVTNPYYVFVLENGHKSIHPLPAAGNFPLPGHFLLDSADRLWMGWDNGEWGGECRYMNLSTGEIRKLGSEVNGVLGFLQAPDDRVLLYGGLDHLGFQSGYIGEVDSSGFRMLSQMESHDDWRAKPIGTLPKEIADRIKAASHSELMPQGPIDLIIADARGGFWISSEQTLFHADQSFENWEKIVGFGGRWIGGRWMSMGNTPTVNRLLLDPTQPDRLIAVMGKDGVESITGAAVAAFRFEGQLEGSGLDLWHTSFGTVMVGSFEGHSLWQLDADEWHRYSLFPDHPPSPDRGWSFAEPFGNEDDIVSAFEQDDIGPGQAYLVRFDNERKAQVIDSWPGDMSQFDTVFVKTSGGVSLKVSEGVISLRDAGAWTKVGKSELESPTDRRMMATGRHMIWLGRTNSADVFLDAQFGDLFQLKHAKGTAEEYRLIRFKTNGHAAPEGIFDAVPDNGDWLFLAAAHGLFSFNIQSGARHAVPRPRGGEDITSLCRDPSGRLWAVGDFLYVSSNEGRNWTKLNLPMFSKTDTKRIRVDALHPGTVAGDSGRHGNGADFSGDREVNSKAAGRSGEWVGLGLIVE